MFTDDQVRQVCLDERSARRDARRGRARHPHHRKPAHRRGDRRRAASHGVDVVDAPVSGGPHDIAAGTVTLFVGGDDDAVERVRPVLASYGDPILHVGAHRCRASGVKLINNTLFAAQIGLLPRRCGSATGSGSTRRRCSSAIGHGSAASRAAEHRRCPGLGATRSSTSVGEFIGKDVAVVRKTAAELGSDLGLLDDVDRRRRCTRNRDNDVAVLSPLSNVSAMNRQLLALQLNRLS